MIFGAKKRSLFDPPERWNTPGIGDDILRRKRGLLGDAPDGFEPVGSQMPPALPDSNSQPGMDPVVRGMLGNAPDAPKGFWQGGGKFRLEDGLAGVLAAIGDAVGAQNGMKPFAVKNLTSGRADGIDKARKANDDFEARQRIASLPGMNAREFAAFTMDPKAWGSNMSRAATSRYDAATLNPGDQRYLGEGQGIYQAPTRGQLYAGSLDLEPGTDPYRDAIRDQELGANGPTAFSNQQAIQRIRASDARQQEILRQQGRMGLEGIRQGNRASLRSMPLPSRAGRLPASAPRKNDLPLVSSPEDALKLPAGTKFRTPDGRVMER